MRECENCHNLIPEGMKICPHCSGLPPTLFPHFFVYLALTCVAIGAAVYFRPFLDGPASGQVVNGVSVGSVHDIRVLCDNLHLRVRHRRKGLFAPAL